MIPCSLKKFNFDRDLLSDISGSVANFGTILPLLLAVSLVNGMNLPLMVTGMGICYILCGLYYKIPVSVEPLKVVASIAIAEQILPEEIAAAGIITGVIFIAIGLTGMMGYLQARIPECVIRGIQLGLALLLFRTAITGFAMVDPHSTIAFTSIILIFFVLRKKFQIPDLSAILIIILGFLFLILTSGMPEVFTLTLPHLTIPGNEAFLASALQIVPAQFPLTLTNAILSTALLISDLYKRTISPDHLSITVGTMSLGLSLAGAFPACHGSGGIAAHYRFGARTGRALLIGGVILILLAVLFSDPRIPANLPPGMFGALLIFVAIELVRSAIRTDNRIIILVMAGISFFAGMAPAFVIGLILAYLPVWKGKEKCK